MEPKFVVSTDSTCDLYANEIKDLGLYVGHLSYTMEKDGVLTEHYDAYTKPEEYVDFYNKLREGYVARTAILNLQAHIDLFTEMAEKGIKHVLHLTQSYGLSPTLDNANKAIEIVKEQFPDIDYIAMHCNTTTIGEGLMVRYACQLRDEGKTNAEARDLIEEIKNKIQHFIVVDDLMYLKRGGRISAVSATVGTMLSLKPIIQFTKAGKLEVSRKEMGLKKALRGVVDEYGKFDRCKDFDRVVIVHTDNLPVAEQLQNMMKERYGIEPEIRIMGPIIGAHVGPNAVAMGFTSNNERPLD